MLDGNQMTAVQGGQKDNTGIDGDIPQGIIWREATNQHGTSTAIAFITALFRATEVFFQTQEIQHGCAGIEPIQTDRFIV